MFWQQGACLPSCCVGRTRMGSMVVVGPNSDSGCPVICLCDTMRYISARRERREGKKKISLNIYFSGGTGPLPKHTAQGVQMPTSPHPGEQDPTPECTVRVTSGSWEDTVSETISICPPLSRLPLTREDVVESCLHVGRVQSRRLKEGQPILLCKDRVRLRQVP